MRIWQDTLPAATRSGVNLSPIDQSLRTEMEVGDPKVRRLTFAKRDVCDVMWRMKDVEFAAFRAWFGDDPYSASGASDDVSTWERASCTRILDADVGPDGQLCDRVVESTSTEQHGIFLVLGNLLPSAKVLLRATLKSIGRQYVMLAFSDSVGILRYATINLGTGVVIGTFGIDAVTVNSRGNGWWRIEIVADNNVGASASVMLLLGVDYLGNRFYTGYANSGFAVCEQQVRYLSGYDLHLPTDALGKATGAGGGSAWFSMAMPLGGGLSVRQCQFIGTYQAKPLAGLNWEVTAKLRVR